MNDGRRTNPWKGKVRLETGFTASVIPAMQWLEEGHEITKDTVLVFEANLRVNRNGNPVANFHAYHFKGFFYIVKDTMNFITGSIWDEDFHFHNVCVLI